MTRPLTFVFALVAHPGTEIALQNTAGSQKSDGVARYTLSVEGAHVGLEAIADDCPPRKMPSTTD